MGSPAHLKVQSNGVDGVLGAPGVILEGSREESLREKEATDPVDGWNAIRDPSFHEVDPLQQVRHPGGQRLQGRVGLGVATGSVYFEKVQEQHARRENTVVAFVTLLTRRYGEVGGGCVSLALPFHMSGTALLNRLLAMSSSSDDITTKPFRALTISPRL